MIDSTDRLIIRKLTDDDIPALSAMLADPEVMRFSVHGVMTTEQTKEFVDLCKKHYRDNGYGSWALQEKETSNFIGFAGLTPTEHNGTERADVGYRLARTYWGKGLATEATAQIIRYGFERLGFDMISCTVLPEHLASIKVAEKVGFSTFELSRLNDMEVRIYQLSVEEWRKINESGGGNYLLNKNSTAN